MVKFWRTLTIHFITRKKVTINYKKKILELCILHHFWAQIAKCIHGAKTNSILRKLEFFILKYFRYVLVLKFVLKFACGNTALFFSSESCLPSGEFCLALHGAGR
jgi:hypothetical protein